MDLQRNDLIVVPIGLLESLGRAVEGLSDWVRLVSVGTRSLESEL